VRAFTRAHTGERRSLLTLLAGSLKSPQRSNRPFTASRSRRAVTLPCGPRRRACRGSKGFCSIPSGFHFVEADAAKTTFLQAFKRPVYPDPRVAGKGILWRGHANQGRCQPGRRAVLEETKEPSDRSYSSLSDPFSQGNSEPRRIANYSAFNRIQPAFWWCGRTVLVACQTTLKSNHSVYELTNVLRRSIRRRYH
jgi:hypothetical protein